MRRWVSVVALAMLVLVGCGNGGPQATNAAVSPGAATPAATPCSVKNGSMQAQHSAGANPPPVALLTDVRPNAEGCPRVVFEFRDQEPGYTVEDASPPFSECGSGEKISAATWDSTAYLSVRLEPAATADQEKEGAPPTYEGPRDIAVRGRVLKHLKVVCDFEAHVDWVIGLDRRHDFSVFTLDDPSRIVIDISET